MKVFLFNVPGFVVARELQKHSFKKWIYFGTKYSVVKKIKRVLDGKAEQIDCSERLYAVTKVQRSQFIRWIDQVATCFPNQKEWLFSVPAVKNTYTSNLFLYICYFFLLKNFITEGEKIDLIFVDSLALAAVFKENFPDRITIAPINRWLRLSFYFKILIKSILRFGKYLVEFGRKFISAKFVLKGRSWPLLQDKRNLVLIRSFITGQFTDIQNDIIESHYFPGLYDYLEKKNYAPVFLPVVTRTFNYRSLYQRVLESKTPIVFPEEFLKFQDYLYAFFTPLRVLCLRLSPPPYGQYQLGRILKEEYYSNSTEFGLLYATLLSCLGKRFKERSLFPQEIINWMENQAWEKGLIKGFRENCTEIKIIGSQSFIFPLNYLSTALSNQERESGLLPDKILVLGLIGKKCATEFIKDVKAEYSPALRYSSAISGDPSSVPGNNLLVLLGYDFDDSIHIIKTLLKIEPHLKLFNSVMIKLHPAGYLDKERLIKAIGQKFFNQYKFLDGKLDQYLDQVCVGVCGASGTAAELVMKGIPVITMGNPYGLTMNYLAYKEDDNMWRLCFSSDQVIEALNHFRVLRRERSQDLIRKAYEFRDAFIAQPSEKYWENYLVEA